MSHSRISDGTGVSGLTYVSHARLHSMFIAANFIYRVFLTMGSDPFLEMVEYGKRYGYVMALWEIVETVPSLFRKIADYEKENRLRTKPVWTALIDSSYLPWPFRPLLSNFRNGDADGNLWNICHFWSNFEIADVDLFRSTEYRQLFEYLDADGGFYYERVSSSFESQQSMLMQIR